MASADNARTNMALIMPEMIDQVPGAALRAAVTLRLAMEVSCGVYIPSTAIKWLPGCLCKTLAYHHESRSHILALVKKRWTSSSSTSASSALSTAGPATHHSAPGEAARQVSSAPRSIDALRVSGLGEDDPVSWLPQPDDPVDSFQDDDVGDVGCGGDGKQMTRSHPLGARRGEGPRVRNRFRPAAGEHSSRILGGAQNDRWSQSCGRFLVRQFSDTPILPVAAPASRRPAGGISECVPHADR